MHRTVCSALRKWLVLGNVGFSRGVGIAFCGKILNFVGLIPEDSGQMKEYENCL